MIKLPKRDCMLPNQIPTRNEHHGDKLHQAMDVILTLAIDRGEFDSIMRRADAHRCFMVQNGDRWEPYFGGVIKPIKLLGEFKDSRVTFFCGVQLTKIEMLKSTIEFRELEAMDGGIFSCKLMASALQTDEMKSLYDFMGTGQKVAISVGKLVEVERKDQGELPLDGAQPAESAAIASPEAERSRAHSREREIAGSIERDRDEHPAESDDERKRRAARDRKRAYREKQRAGK